MSNAKPVKMSQGLAAVSLFGLTFFPTVIDCMIGHSVRRRCGVEMLQQVPVKSVEIFTRTTHVVAELHVSLAHYPAFPFTLCRGFFTPEIWLVPRKMMRSPICC